MAKKEPVKGEEKLVTIPLRKSWIKKPRQLRAKRSIATIRWHVARFLKAAEVKISPSVSEAIFSRSIQKPQSKIRVKVVLEGDVAKVMLPNETQLGARPGPLERRKAKLERFAKERDKKAKAKPAEPAKPAEKAPDSLTPPAAAQHIAAKT